MLERPQRDVCRGELKAPGGAGSRQKLCVLGYLFLGPFSLCIPQALRIMREKVHQAGGVALRQAFQKELGSGP